MKHLTTALLLCGTSLLAATAAGAQTLTVQTSFSSGDYSTRFLTEEWLPKIAERTDGRIHITLVSNGAVVPPRETPEAVAAGVLDGDWTGPHYFSGVEPAFGLLGDLIAGYDTPEQMMGFCREGPGAALLQEAMDVIQQGEVTVVACGPYSREALVSRVPIRTFDDLKGKKIRAPEGLASAVFAAAGATPVNIPFTEVFGALEKGIVDAADVSAYVNNDAIGIHEVAPYPLYPGIHSMPSMQFTLSTATWEDLSPEDQATLRDWWYDAMIALREAVAAEDEALVARDTADPNITVINWAQEDRDKLRAVARTQWEAYAEKSPLARKVYEAHVAYMHQIGLLDD
ncbi:TRAP transporter substrate-binding protein DctP [Pseudooceanicola sp. CBS1P-1]|uniref:C4-dicarboxylate ABC transporter substrate-binding protein n=1 Tax=Pseudooceanicola albus TaxID=2692189 RepID=A0A6L7GA18_9RHOB|nr:MULTISPECIES: TRAP transporter substrate-binding protein DctP [Pseudooceanicola]MBT9386892.1 TRAP transporter substrate-binding protein DctP [Pseudooceanicola endophyticus]MXN21054.1 C4-dicarboxylate ABC transporter substrate-binding protein [Pseudooceanicola albus]